MPRKRKNKQLATALPVLNPDAAGVDIGATEIYVAVSPEGMPARYVHSRHLQKS